MSRQDLKNEILRRSGVDVPTRFLNCMVYENVNTFEALLEITPEEAFRIPNFGARCVDLLKQIQRSQDPALHQNNQHLLKAVKDRTVEVIMRLRKEIPAFNELSDTQQVGIILNLHLKDFEAFKTAALRKVAGANQSRLIVEAMKQFGL